MTDSLWLNLDDAAFARKLSAAQNYPELQAEVETALNGAGNETFRQLTPELAERLRTHLSVSQTQADFHVECLRPVNVDTRLAQATRRRATVLRSVWRETGKGRALRAGATLQ